MVVGGEGGVGGHNYKTPGLSKLVRMWPLPNLCSRKEVQRRKEGLTIECRPPL